MLKIVYEDKAASIDLVTCERRIWLDKDGQAVVLGHRAILYSRSASGRSAERALAWDRATESGKPSSESSFLCDCGRLLFMMLGGRVQPW